MQRSVEGFAVAIFQLPSLVLLYEAEFLCSYIQVFPPTGGLFPTLYLGASFSSRVNSACQCPWQWVARKLLYWDTAHRPSTFVSRIFVYHLCRTLTFKRRSATHVPSQYPVRSLQGISSCVRPGALSWLQLIAALIHAPSLALLNSHTNRDLHCMIL